MELNSSGDLFEPRGKPQTLLLSTAVLCLPLVDFAGERGALLGGGVVCTLLRVLRARDLLFPRLGIAAGRVGHLARMSKLRGRSSHCGREEARVCSQPAPLGRRASAWILRRRARRAPRAGRRAQLQPPRRARVDARRRRRCCARRRGAPSPRRPQSGGLSANAP
jgi:hypothetical protein